MTKYDFVNNHEDQTAVLQLVEDELVSLSQLDQNIANDLKKNRHFIEVTNYEEQ